MTKAIQKTKRIYGHLAIVKLCQIAAYDATLGDAAKRTLSILAGFCGVEEFCYPSIATIAGNSCVSRAAIQNQVKILEEHSYLTREARYGANGSRKPSIITLNGDLAREHASCPEIFCKANVTLMISYLVTLLYYRGGKVQVLTSHVTSGSDINKINSIKQIEENKLNKTRDIVSKRKKLRANNWESKKQKQKDVGISNKGMASLEAIVLQLDQYMTAYQKTHFSISVMKEIKGMSLKESGAHQITRYQEKLRELEAQSTDAS